MGLAFDSAGNLYIADNLQNRVRKVDSSGIISTYAGTGVAGYNGDGAPASTLQLNGPSGLAFDKADNLFISDSNNARIRKVAVNGTMTTVAGTGEQGLGGDGGPAISAALRIPGAITIDGAGNIYILDYGNSRVRKILPGGLITTVAGNGNQGTFADLSVAATSALNLPSALSVDQNGVIYVGESGRIRKVGLDGLLRTVLKSFSAAALFADAAGNVWESDSNMGIYEFMPVPTFCSYTVSPPAAQVSAGGTLNLTVTTAPGCSWSALSTTPWITYTGATGVTANFTLSPNSTQATRTGTIAIAGQNVTISQNASALNTTVFVTALYQDLLNRAPDPGGLNYYVTYINDATLTKAQAAAQFFTSPEFSSAGLYVIKLYSAVLKRDPDFAGWKYWFDTMHSGLPPTTVLNSFINSPEFQQLYGSVTNANFVNLVYQNVLGRQPDTAGYAYWLKLIDDGSITRAVLMDDFVRSPEYDNSVRARAYANLLYMGFLRRAADPAGLTFWTSVLNDPAALPEAIRGFILSPEYLNRF
jgi:sugar lactone lactonase YvrE